MHRRVRHILFFVFALAFAVGAPLVVLYTAGYRINPSNGHIVRTGVFSVSSLPRGAAIAFDGTASTKTTPYVFNRMMPGTYVVTLTRDGYHAWSDDVTVASGRNTYRSDVRLLLDRAPSLVFAQESATVVPSPATDDIAFMTRTDRTVQLWRMTPNDAPTMVTEYPARAADALTLAWTTDAQQLTLRNITQDTVVTFSREGVVLEDADNGMEIGGRWMLIDNGRAVEVHDALSSTSVPVAILPPDDYRIAEADDRFAVVVTKRKVTLLDFAAANPITLTADGTVYDWDAGLRRLAWSDGIEVHTFSVDTGETSFVTRQSDAIIDLAWHPDGDTLFVSTNDDITALSFSTDHGTLATRLVAATGITRFWREDDDATVYFYGVVDGVTGIYVLAVTK